MVYDLQIYVIDYFNMKLDGFVEKGLLDKEQVMEILEMLHTEEFLNDSRYDEIRNACSEKIKSY